MSFDWKCNLALPSFGCMLCSFCLITASFIFGLCWFLVDAFCKENVLTDLCTYFTAMNYLVTSVHFLCSCFSLCLLTVSSSNFCASHEAPPFSFCDYTAAWEKTFSLSLMTVRALSISSLGVRAFLNWINEHANLSWNPLLDLWNLDLHVQIFEKYVLDWSTICWSSCMIQW